MREVGCEALLLGRGGATCPGYGCAVEAGVGPSLSGDETEAEAGTGAVVG